MKRATLTILLVLALGGWARAQNILGSITGLVQDPSGAVVPAAKITALNQETGVRYPATATAAGVYVIPQVPMGRYTVTVEATGFKTFVQKGLEVQGGVPLRVDARLELGNAKQEVTVTGAAPLVQTDNATLGGNFSRREFDALPIGAGSFYSLTMMALVPGSIPTSTIGFSNGSFNGANVQTVDYKVDGTPTTLTSDNTILAGGPIEEMTEEVVLQNGNYSAEYGRGVAQISVNTISGTNKYHGTLFEYFQNEALDANSYFNNLHGNPRSRDRANTFGATIGGPVVIPHVVNGHDKLFFSFGYQGKRSTPQTSVTASVPTLAMRNGDFTGAGLSTIYDPATTTKLANGTYTRTAFAGNKIPTNRMDPVALKILAAAQIPLPNVPGAGITNNYFTSGAGPLANSTWQGRLDYNINEKHRLTFRMDTFYQAVLNFMKWPGPAGNNSGQTLNNDQDNTSESAEYTYTIRPNLVNVAHFGYFYARIFRFGPGTYENWAGKLGIKNAGPDTFPGISITQVAGFGNSALNIQYPSRNYVFTDTLLHVKGRHSIKYGFEYRREKVQTLKPNGGGTFSFDTSPTNNPANGKLGNGFASFLLGIPTSSSLSLNPETFFDTSWPYYAAFVQDDFRVNKKLTLNLGLRWEINLPYKEAHNYMSNFNLATGQLQYAGLNGYPDTLYDAYYKGFAPRVGFAYSPFGDNKTVIRGGFGFFELQNSAIGGAPFEGVGPWAQNVSFPSPDKVTFPITLSGGFPLITLGAFPTLGPNLNVTTVANRNFTPPYMEMWNFNVQRQLGSATMLQVGYTANVGRHLPSTIQYNTVPPDKMGAGNAQLKRPYPNVGAISNSAGGIGVETSSYNALQVILVRRLHRGLSMNVSYNFSKSIHSFPGNVQNWYDLAAEKSVTNINPPHMLNYSVVWELPVGKDRHFLNRGGWVNALIGGWDLSTLSRNYSGVPMTMGVQQNQTNTLGGGERPNRLGNPVLPGSQRGLSEWFNTAMFALPPQYSYGNDSSTEPQLHGPGEFFMRAMLSKQVHFTERWWGEIRCEANNAPNHFNPGDPNTTVGNPNFGVISGGGGGRTMIMVLRIHF
jgi:Carboxypeptidase regulatory-like domain